MELKTFTIDFQNIAKEKTFRYDVDFANFQRSFLIGEYYSFNDLFEFKKNNKVNLSNSDQDFHYCEIGNVSKESEVTPVKLNFGKRREEEENYYTKIEKGDIIKVEKNDLLVSKIRPNLKKYVLVDNETSNCFFTSAFIHLKPKKLNKILYYSLKTIFSDNLIAVSRQGKGYPTLKEEDLFDIKFNKNIIDKFTKNQNQIIAEIEPLENKIKDLRAQITPPQEVMNKIFAREFEFDLDVVNSAERITNFIIDTDITYRNRNLRSSVRWNKIKAIQQSLYNNLYVEKLGKFILSTKNGWSPNCKEMDTKNVVFGVNSICKDGYIKFEDLKYSDEENNNTKDYFVKENDLFVTRGNTVDLVALASIVKDLPEDRNYIFPDLFIRIELNTKRLNKEYLVFIFNSIIGRYYFKYSSKGKNQTMVKISSEELNNFYFPVPPISIQQKIVDEIKLELNKQKEIKKKIANKRKQIYSLIENILK